MRIAVRQAEIDDVDDVADLIARAFQGLAVSQWLAADPADRLTCMRAQFAILIAHAVDHGQVDVMADDTGAAVWFDRTSQIPEPAGYDQQLRQICGAQLTRFVSLDEALAAHHPEEPHHHAAFLAVRPDVQRRGIGKALLEHHHRFLDQEGIPAYLEASDTNTRDIYARLGYTVAAPIELPEGPPMWPMWREPAAFRSMPSIGRPGETR